MTATIIIRPQQSGEGVLSFPRIAPGTFIDEGTVITGNVHIDTATIFDKATIRGERFDGQSNYFQYGKIDDRLKQSCVYIGPGSVISNHVSIHTTTEYDSPVTIGKDVIVGHGVIMHGCTVGDNAVIFQGSIVNDNAIVQQNSFVAAGCVIPERKEVIEGWVVCRNPMQVLMPEAPQTLVDRTTVVGFDEQKQVISLVAGKAQFAHLPNNDADNRPALNISHTLYCLDCAEELFHQTGHTELMQQAIKAREAYEICNNLRRTPQGTFLGAAAANPPAELQAAFQESMNHVHNGLGRVTAPVNVESSVYRNGVGFEYDSLHIDNIKAFVGLVAKTKDINQIHAIDVFAPDSGIKGAWAYYGLSRHDMALSTATPRLPTSPVQCCEWLQAHPKLVDVFLSKKRPELYALAETEPTGTLTNLVLKLQDMAQGEETPLVEKKQIGKAFLNLPTLLQQARDVSDSQTIYANKLQEHVNDLGDYKYDAGFTLKFPGLNRDIQQACQGISAAHEEITEVMQTSITLCRGSSRA